MPSEIEFANLVKAIVANDIAAVRKVLGEIPAVSKQVVEVGATRENPKDFFVDELQKTTFEPINSFSFR